MAQIHIDPDSNPFLWMVLDHFVGGIVTLFFTAAGTAIGFVWGKKQATKPKAKNKRLR